MSDRCDQDVYENGTVVCLLNGPRSHTIEDWVQDVAAASGQVTDWSMAAGWAVIKTLGDPQRVRGSDGGVLAAAHQCVHDLPGQLHVLARTARRHRAMASRIGDRRRPTLWRAVMG